MTATENLMQSKPDISISVNQAFGFDTDLHVEGFSKKSEYVPEIDSNYCFDKATTMAILSGFKYNRRVMVQGLHGTGKSTHIEQIAARLNWPCVRVNLDSHISRIDLIGKDAIVLNDGNDAGRPDVMFVIQRVLESEGKFTLLDKNRVLTPNPYFRLFATTNTVGLGDTTGLYHGTQQINQGQMDRWSIVTTLNYLDLEQEKKIMLSKVPSFNNPEKEEIIEMMIKVADLSRKGLANGDISTVMSPRTVLTWAQNSEIFDHNYSAAFKLTFLNKCDESERQIIAEYYQRCFGEEVTTEASKFDLV